jgi:hypothetical protein
MDWLRIYRQFIAAPLPQSSIGSASGYGEQLRAALLDEMSEA